MGRTHFVVFAFAGLTMTLAAVAAAKPATLDTDPNLAAWWKLDETAGTMAADASGHKHNGTLQGGLAFDDSSVEGKAGRALRFADRDSAIEVKQYKGVTGTRPRCVAAWVKTANSRGRIVSWGTEDFGQMFIFGFVRGRIGITPHGGYLYMNEQTDDNEWHHVAAVVRRAERPNLHDDVLLYLDGTVAEIHDIGLLDLWPLRTGDELNVRIGHGFTGALDDLRIYDRPLSEGQIKALFESETDRPLSEIQ